MKVNHHQIKNAVARLAKQYAIQFPNEPRHLGSAVFRSKQSAWELRIYLPVPKGETIDIFVPTRPLITVDELDIDENISFENIPMETAKLGLALDVAARFINHSEKIGSVSLMYLLDESTETDKKWKLDYAGQDNQNKYIYLTLVVDTRTEAILNIELDYPRKEVAIEIAEKFIKQSDKILSTTTSYYNYYGKGIYEVLYRGLNLQGEMIYLNLKIDTRQKIILSHEITSLKSDEK